MRLLTAIALTLLSIQASADNLGPDKRAHFIGGIFTGGVATAAADRFWPEHRLLAGILLGTLPGLGIEIADSTNDAGFSTGDLLADFTGALIGAFVTDTWILKPVVSGGPNQFVGLEFNQDF